MGSRERRARQRAETRKMILEAARELFVSVGYEGTTMRAIAERIEYTPTAIYHHFRNKQALLAELCRADLTPLLTAMECIDAVADPVERLRRLCEAYVSFGLTHPMHYQLMFMTRLPKTDDADAIPSDPLENTYRLLCDTCAAVIESGQVHPEFTDPEELAQMLWSAMHGVLALHIVKKEGAKIEWRDPHAAAIRLRDSLLRGLLSGAPATS